MSCCWWTVIFMAAFSTASSKLHKAECVWESPSGSSERDAWVSTLETVPYPRHVADLTPACFAEIVGHVHEIAARPCGHVVVSGQADDFPVDIHYGESPVAAANAFHAQLAWIQREARMPIAEYMVDVLLGDLIQQHSDEKNGGAVLWPVPPGPFRTVVLCSVWTGAADFSRAAAFVQHHIQLGVDHVVIYDIGTMSAIDALLKGLRHIATAYWTVARLPPTARTPLAAYQTCHRVYGLRTTWITFLDVFEEVVAATSVLHLVSRPELGDKEVIVFCVHPDTVDTVREGFQLTVANRTYPPLRSLVRASHVSITSTIVPCPAGGRSSVVEVEGGAVFDNGIRAWCRWDDLWVAVDLAAQAHRLASHNGSLLAFVRRVGDSVPRRFAGAASAGASACPESIKWGSVTCAVHRRKAHLLLRLPLDQARIPQIIARRRPRLAYTMMVYGEQDSADTLRRLFFTVDSLREVGARGDIVVFVPHAGYLKAALQSMLAKRGARIRIVDFVNPPSHCTSALPTLGPTATVYQSLAHAMPMHMQLASWTLTEYDAVAYLDGIDMLLRRSFEPELEAFARSLRAFAAAGDNIDCLPESYSGPVPYFSAGLMFLKPSRAVFGALNSAGPDTLCGYANQDVLNTVLWRVWGRKQFSCMPWTLHCIVRHTNCTYASVLHFAGGVKPWTALSADSPPEFSRPQWVDTVAEYNSEYSSWLLRNVNSTLFH